MVRDLIVFFLLLPSILVSGEFVASVDRNPINAGDPVTLTLTLKEASAKGSPALGDLKQLFIVHSQQQSSSTMVRNGHVSSSTSWQIVLTPKREEATIPSISIQTSEGVLSSEPIAIRVAKGNPDTSEVTLTTDLSEAKPYKNQPLFYTVRLTSKLSMMNVGMDKLSIEDAIVEMNGEPKIFQKFVDGIRMEVIEFNYLITPLKAGPLKIPSVHVQGGTPLRKRSLDDFFMMERLKPFALATAETTLEVQPPLMNPWLPARSIKIEEVWDDSQALRVGEPLMRGFKIVAEGAMSSQLPNLNDLQINGFKIYADKPETGDEIQEGSLHSFRKEHYTLIPQEAGVLTLPEISIPWWNVSTKERAVARLPGRKLQILPGIETKQNQESLPISQEVVIQWDPLLYALLAGLAILLLAAIGWGIVLQNKIRRLTAVESKKTDKAPSQTPFRRSVKEKKEKLPDLNPT